MNKVFRDLRSTDRQAILQVKMSRKERIRFLPRSLRFFFEKILARI